MALFMLVWKSHDPKVTTSLFASGVLDVGSKEEKPSDLVEDVAIPQNIKLQVSVHVVGQPQGFVLLQATPEEIHQLVLAIPPESMEIEVFSVITDAEAKIAMQTRNSAYKLK